MDLSTDITTTIIPWLLGGLIALAALSSALTIYSWRESKRSPYYFLRRQAEQQMQTYSLTTIGLLVGLLFVGTYAWQGPQDTTMRVALIDNAKPTLVANSVNQLPSNERLASAPAMEANEQTVSNTPNTAVPEIVVLRGANSAELSLASLRELGESQPNGAVSVNLDDTAVDALSLDETVETEENGEALELKESAEAALPPEFSGLSWSTELSPDTDISPLIFSNDVDADLRATNPSRLFKEGSYTIYATFEYAGMNDGMSWSWVWRFNGQVISGGHELWNYGDEGPGYVFLNPEEGFSPGEYVVEIWVNEELTTQANLFVTVDTAANN